MLQKEAVVTEKAPQPIGQYSQAIKAGNLLFLAGQVGQDPRTGKVPEGDIEAEIRQAFENIKNIVESAGSSLEFIVRTLTFVTDLNIYPHFRKVRAEYLPTKAPPVNSFIQASGLQLGASIEIEAIALIPDKLKRD